jgi:hypothetical protein
MPFDRLASTSGFGRHTGEVETIDRKVGGLAVIIGSRIEALAGASETSHHRP